MESMDALKTEEDIQKKVDDALIEANIFPDIPLNIKAMAQQLGFAIREFKTLPANVIGCMFLKMEPRMAQLVKSNKLIGLNASSDEYHKRFAIAHEIGHYIMHYDFCKDKENPVFLQVRDNEKGIEAEACKFAAMLLMNRKDFSKAYHEIENLEEIDIIRQLSKKFQAPQASVRRRIEELKLHA